MCSMYAKIYSIQDWYEVNEIKNKSLDDLSNINEESMYYSITNFFKK